MRRLQENNTPYSGASEVRTNGAALPLAIKARSSEGPGANPALRFGRKFCEAEEHIDGCALFDTLERSALYAGADSIGGGIK